MHLRAHDGRVRRARVSLARHGAIAISWQFAVEARRA